VPTVGRNLAFLLAQKASGVRFDPHPAFNFFIEVEGILTGGFTECSGLQVETKMESYSEGGLNEYDHAFRGRTTYPPLMLKHGLTMLDGLWGWHQDVIQGEVTRKNGTIYLLNSMGIPVTWWNFKGGLPVKWTGPELRANSSEVAFESIELVHQGLGRPSLRDLKNFIMG
jgi:phage tail-like protein